MCILLSKRHVGALSPFGKRLRKLEQKKKMFKRFFSTYVLSDYEQASKLIEETWTFDWGSDSYPFVVIYTNLLFCRISETEVIFLGISV